MYGKAHGNRFTQRTAKSGSAPRKSVAEILRISYRRYARDPFAEIAVNSVLGRPAEKRAR